MKRKYKPGDKRYSDFIEDGAVNADKLRWCKNCEQWIPPPGIHTCHDAKAERAARRTKQGGDITEEVR